MAKTQNPLRKLTKLQLLELLAQQERELQSLRQQLVKAEAALADRQIRLEEAGSIAEAALRLNGIFEAAQQAADQYLSSIRSLESAKAAAAVQEAPPGDSSEV